MHLTPRLRAAYRVLGYVHRRGIHTSKTGRHQWCVPSTEEDFQKLAQIISEEQQVCLQHEMHAEPLVQETENSIEATWTKTLQSGPPWDSNFP